MARKPYRVEINYPKNQPHIILSMSITTIVEVGLVAWSERFCGMGQIMEIAKGC